MRWLRLRRSGASTRAMVATATKATSAKAKARAKVEFRRLRAKARAKAKATTAAGQERSGRQRAARRGARVKVGAEIGMWCGGSLGALASRVSEATRPSTRPTTATTGQSGPKNALAAMIAAPHSSTNGMGQMATTRQKRSSPLWWTQACARARTTRRRLAKGRRLPLTRLLPRAVRAELRRGGQTL